MHKETEIAIGTVIMWMALSCISNFLWDNKYITHLQVLIGACIVVGVFVLGSIFFNYDKKEDNNETVKIEVIK
jgi:uncharacterized BrkB/YihY/UPF0761 family membrane protein